MRELYRSPNGDRWLLDREPDTGQPFVRHEANIPSGGKISCIDIGKFLVGGARNPEHQALLHLIATLVPDAPPDAQRAIRDNDRSDADTGKGWSDMELSRLGDMLTNGFSLEEIARALRRGHREVRDKVAEVGRACKPA